MKLTDEAIRVAMGKPRKRCNPLRCVPVVLAVWMAVCYWMFILATGGR